MSHTFIVFNIMAAAEPLYESMDEIARLTIAIGRMNVDNVSPIFGVGKALDLGFKESLEKASVSFDRNYNCSNKYIMYVLWVHSLNTAAVMYASPDLRRLT